MIISAFEIMKVLIKCCSTDCLKNINVYYDGDPNTHRNSAIFVRDVIGEAPFTFEFSVRGTPKNGKSTTEIAGEILLFLQTNKNLIVTDEETNDDYMVNMYIGNAFLFNGIDEVGRTDMSNQITIKSIKKIRS